MAFASAYLKCSMTQKIQCGALNVFDFVADVQKSQAYFTFRSDSAHVSSWQNQEIPALSLDQLLQCMIPLLAQSGHGDRAQRCPLLGVKRTSPKRPLMCLLLTQSDQGLH